MYISFYNFLEKNKKKEIIFLLQFGFRRKCSTTHALSYPTDKIRDDIDKGNYACGICVGFQNVFNTVDHHILLKKITHM